MSNQPMGKLDMDTQVDFVLATAYERLLDPESGSSWANVIINMMKVVKSLPDVTVPQSVMSEVEKKVEAARSKNLRLTGS